MSQKEILANVLHPTDYESRVAVEVSEDDDGTIGIVCRGDGGVVAIELNSVMAARLSVAIGEAVALQMKECSLTIGYMPGADE